MQITNTGGAGTLNWNASIIEGAAWLSVNPSSGTAPSNMLVSANTTNLTSGTYTGKVRVTGQGSVFNSPVDINVTMTVTAPQFSVRPGKVSWYYQPGNNPGQRVVEVVGASVNWHAGAVPTSMVPLIEEAIANGTPLRFDNGRLMIGDQPAPEDVPIVDWIDINPSVGTATQSGTAVQLNLVTGAVPYGFTTAAVVFVADAVASPPAVVVRASVLRSLADQSDLTFMPSVQLLKTLRLPTFPKSWQLWHRIKSPWQRAGGFVMQEVVRRRLYILADQTAKARRGNQVRGHLGV